MNASSFATPLQHPDTTVLSVRQLLHGHVLGPDGAYLGYVFDIAVRPREGGYPHVTGVLACIGIREAFLTPATIAAWHTDAVSLRSVPDAFPPAPAGDVHLRYSLLGRRFTAGGADTFRARDVLLEPTPEGWILTTVDTRGPLARRWAPSADGELVDWMSLVPAEVPADR